MCNILKSLINIFYPIKFFIFNKIGDWCYNPKFLNESSLEYSKAMQTLNLIYIDKCLQLLIALILSISQTTLLIHNKSQEHHR